MNFVVKTEYNKQDIIDRYSLKLVKEYSTLNDFFVVDMDLETAELVRNDPRVKYVIIDRKNEFSLQVLNDNPELKSISVNETLSDTQVTSDQWHLNYLMKKDHSGIESQAGIYTYTRTGTNVDVYVMDSGIVANHEDFRNPETNLFDRVSAIPDWTSPAGDHLLDGDGHGTHVAGIIGGRVSGVAKKCHLYSVRVFDSYGGSITTSEMINAFNAVIAHHNTKGNARGSVLNLSLGASPTSADPYVYFNDPGVSDDDYLDDMVHACADAGITVVIAAGNGFSNGDGQNYVFHGRMNARFNRPARTEVGITVGALNPDSGIASYSNYGKNVDIFAPGSSVFSAYNLDTMALISLNGTSMACPVVAGMCALYLEGNVTASPTKVRSFIIDKCSVDAQVKNIGTTGSTDGVISSSTVLYYYDSTQQIVGPVDYPSSEISADRVLYSPFANTNKISKYFKYSNGRYTK